MKETLKNTTNSRVYRIIFSHYYGIDWLEDARNSCYVSTRRRIDSRNWKRYRKTQWKDKNSCFKS